MLAGSVAGVQLAWDFHELGPILGSMVRIEVSRYPRENRVQGGLERPEAAAGAAWAGRDREAVAAILRIMMASRVLVWGGFAAN